ncbi:MAG: hypothetical protein N2044_03040 [Cyclobacteriaceae bacterium]|nr:hypothetical protein [Cyclobacteriaceae bacterium]MCX7636801.1 hypothetical protein [Cyclobacteriaceae bacterium]MDW8331308.1 hypothetical protein [Cyclobacteriaceae bacterium]
MRLLASILSFFVILFLLDGCFEPPQFSSKPEISISKIEFYETPGLENADTIILHIDFRDGDGDMGFDALNPQHSSDPFHPNFYYLEGPGFTVIKNPTDQVNVNAPDPIPSSLPVLKDIGNTGKLVRLRTRNKAGYGYLPPLASGDLGCRNYRIQYLIIPYTMPQVVDSTYNIVARSTRGDVIVQDTLYYRVNRNHYNLRVRFYQRVGSSLQEYSWEQNFCTTFNSRYPILSETEGPTEGTLKYKMTSIGFLTVFGVRPIALDVIVSDRALNRDSVRVSEFTLDLIRVN